MKFLKAPNSKHSVAETLRWLWIAGKGNRVQAVANALLGLLDVAVSLAVVWAMKRAIDIATTDREGILPAVAVLGALILGHYAISILRIWVKNILGVKAQNKMQQRMLGKILRSEWQSGEMRHSGDIMNRLEQDVITVVNFLAETLPNTLSTAALFLGAFLYMFSMDKLLAVIIVAIIPVFVLFSRIYFMQMRRLTHEVRSSDSKIQSVLQETVQNRMLIKTLEGDDAMMERLESSQSTLRERVERRTWFSIYSHLILNFGFSLGYLTAFLWAALRMADNTLSFGGMTAFLQLVNRIQSPARTLTQLAPAFVSVFTAAERLMELEETPMEEQGEPLFVKAPCGIKVEGLSFGYSAAAKVFDDFSYKFRPGTCTAILGETGSGKTTLIRLLLALLHPQKGTVSIFNADGEEQNVNALTRCNFVYVPQGNTLLSGTIRNNLLLGNPQATDAMMWDALATSCADFVSQLPKGLDSDCSEKGGGLSEGQCQRISIARALLRNRPIMLFDESTSALDPETEERLLRNILASRDKTIVFITHRMAVTNYCDDTLTFAGCASSASLLK